MDPDHRRGPEPIDTAAFIDVSAVTGEGFIETLHATALPIGDVGSCIEKAGNHGTSPVFGISCCFAGSDCYGSVAICLHAIQWNDVSLRRVLLFPLQNREPKEDGVRNAKVNSLKRRTRW